MSKQAITLVGRSRTTNSPGTPLRRPNSSARSGPMYRADRRRRRDQLRWILRQFGYSLDLDERIRRLLKVHADRGARVASQRPALSSVLASVEHQPVAVDHEPHRNDQRTTVSGAIAQLARPSPLQQEGANLRVGDRVHASQSRHAQRGQECPVPVDLPAPRRAGRFRGCRAWPAVSGRAGRGRRGCRGSGRCAAGPGCCRGAGRRRAARP
jgi:hypothetical protein